MKTIANEILDGWGDEEVTNERMKGILKVMVTLEVSITGGGGYILLESKFFSWIIGMDRYMIMK